ncbi:hypothetical protein [Paraburkholderia rhynchosiae]|uniref:Uncharacterized protein n=1 Tax=Paraburkholderia rhynchosiae TaxID=487049 RepID=A0A2N7WVG8_9BURK|nr:hypothetical protein [Paraburkholderia rhynchosiae]PMS33478.1 hypothetical protein C0Z16_02525 [Paraburkholderia rhynchosiae]CAB3681423.1 hypothetical protein LMG27174_02689 [Paraburkholderia rhynchosiae]
MSVVPKPIIALHRKRLVGALVALPLCALIGACGNDDARVPDTSNISPTHNSADNSNTAAVLSANPSSVPASPSPAAVTIQSPALPASSADPALSAAGSTPLATPVIHTVD